MKIEGQADEELHRVLRIRVNPEPSPPPHPVPPSGAPLGAGALEKPEGRRVPGLPPLPPAEPPFVRDTPFSAFCLFQDESQIRA